MLARFSNWIMAAVWLGPSGVTSMNRVPALAHSAGFQPDATLIRPAPGPRQRHQHVTYR
jgi:hypothetical protein